MNARQEAKLSMYRAAQLHCEANTIITAGNAAFATAYTNFKSQISTLIGSETVVSKQTNSLAKDKDSKRVKLYRTATDVAALLDYGVTAAMVTAFQTSITNYTNASPSTQAAKTTENAKIKDTIKLADDVLKSGMDKLVVTFKAANPNFVSTHFNARVIINPQTSTKTKTKAKS
ncbi:MAG: hypothetical protein ACKVOM_05035 [Ferruginibacter sp.]